MAVFAPWLAPHDTSDVGTLDLMQALRPPVWLEGGDWAYLLGTDDQGRDMLSGIIFGARTSLLVSGVAVLLATLLGTAVGLFCGWVGGRPDAVLMRIAEVQLSFPAILIVLLIDGLGRTAVSTDLHNVAAVPVLIIAIALSNWVQIARTVRGSSMAEKNKEYVQAARVLGIHPAAILLRHILPNIFAPVLVIATLGIAGAILTEATLSFLGVGVPPTQPSLGTLIRFGNNFLISGEWWMTVFPGLALVLLALSVNIVGDWLRDVLNPKLS
ncbi:MAG: ABC transporter permease [Rhodospirillales bacterium]|nr:ABC transporter permease [Rhodospirillales bacterium]